MTNKITIPRLLVIGKVRIATNISGVDHNLAEMPRSFAGMRVLPIPR
jgi:hypothetical protein